MRKRDNPIVAIICSQAHGVADVVAISQQLRSAESNHPWLSGGSRCHFQQIALHVCGPRGAWRANELNFLLPSEREANRPRKAAPSVSDGQPAPRPPSAEPAGRFATPRARAQAMRHNCLSASRPPRRSRRSASPSIAWPPPQRWQTFAERSRRMRISPAPALWRTQLAPIARGWDCFRDCTTALPC